MSLKTQSPTARRDYYDEISAGYDELYGEEQKRKLMLVKANISINPRHKLLDIGCGTGVSSGFDCFVVGIDPALGLLKLNPNNKILGVAESLPFRANSFDFVISLTAIHNFGDYERAIGEMKRVSRHYIIVSVLKRAKVYKEIAATITKVLRIERKINEEKDTLFFCAKYK